MSDTVAGLLTVLAAGVCQGSFMLPMKWTKRWQWENTWLIFAFSAYLMCPWLIVLTTVPQAFAIYASVPSSTLWTVILCGAGWGAGAVTFGLGVSAVGLALGFSVILGLAACAGTLAPLLLTGHDMGAARLTATLLSLALMLAGVATCSFAGKWREAGEKGAGKLSYRAGLAVCVASGLLSACGNFGFVYGAPIVEAARQKGVDPRLGSNLIWSLLTLAMFACNGGFALRLLWRNHSTGNFALPGTRRYFLFGLLMGVLWIVGFVLYGLGANRLGSLGPSLGWAILMSSMVLAANLLGLATGEWREAPAGPKRHLALGLALLMVAIAGLGYANRVRS